MKEIINKKTIKIIKNDKTFCLQKKEYYNNITM